MKKRLIFLIVSSLISFEIIASITLISDPKVLSIPIDENHEDWVDLRSQKIILYGPSPEVENNHDYTFMRKTVYEKLKIAQNHLPHGMRFCLYEGYRSLRLQKMIFEKQYHQVKLQHPNWSEKEIFLETTKLVSPVINPDKSMNIPPHSTGAAIDIYLIDGNGLPLDMGIHPKDWMKDKGGVLSLTDSKLISKQARKNRQIMSKALSQIGFVNYPTEFWHWSYGDRYWAYTLEKPHAIYGNLYSPKQ
jgi:D-alanyl-D-alanine dipeptidase